MQGLAEPGAGGEIGARDVAPAVLPAVVEIGNDRLAFGEFYGEGVNVATSQLASGWRMPPLRSGDRQPVAV